MSEVSRFDIIKVYRERQDKFVYYVAGLNVAAIGFTLTKTFDIKLTSNHIFLGASLLCWIVSILCAFFWINNEFRGMRLDMHSYDLEAGVWNELGEPIPEGMTEVIKKTLRNVSDKKAKQARRAYDLMLLLFMLGIFSFIFWRVLELL